MHIGVVKTIMRAIRVICAISFLADIIYTKDICIKFIPSLAHRLYLKKPRSRRSGNEASRTCTVQTTKASECSQIGCCFAFLILDIACESAYRNCKARSKGPIFHTMAYWEPLPDASRVLSLTRRRDVCNRWAYPTRIVVVSCGNCPDGT